MSKILSDAVTHDGETWDFHCPGFSDSPCGDPGGQAFTSSGWPSKKVAQARGAQHFAEHKGEGLMASLDDFRAEHGLTSHPDGRRAVSIEDLS